MKLKDRVAIITGGGAGIGQAISLRFATEGARVVILDLDEGSGNETAAMIRQGGGTAVCVQGDVSNEGDVKRCVEKTIAEFGAINILVNNAAYFVFENSLEASTEEWDRTYEVNIKGTVLMTRHAVPEMEKSGGGSIVNLGSTVSLIGIPNMAPYVMSKTAILGLTRAMAIEFGPYNIRVNIICPGTIMTEATKRVISTRNVTVEEAEKMESGRIIFDRFGTPEEMANVALFLASDESSYITGSHIVADGGLVAM